MHVEQVLGDVPVANRCRCREQPPQTPGTNPEGTPPSGPRGWLKGLLGK
jgi:hypothetical protein